jgi:ADP-ribose pyrophosphatase YjhB (NUDIX family)
MIESICISQHIYKYCPLCGKKLGTDLIEGKKRRNCPACGFVDYHNPLPCVSIIGIKEDKIALIKRGIEPSKGSWAPPSGFMEYGETPEETALRELYEETSLKAKVIKLLGVYNQHTKIYGNLVVIIFLVNITGGKIKAGDDAEDARFFRLDKIPLMKYDFYNTAIENAKKWILKHKKGK